MVYRGSDRYTLSTAGDSSPVEASSWLEEDGRVKGFVGERTFQADVAMVDRQLHVFTKVSRNSNYTICTVGTYPCACS